MNDFSTSLICALIAGIVRWMWLWDFKNVKRLVKLLPTSLLVGYFSYQLCLYYKVDKHLVSVIVGISGLSSPEILLLMRKFLLEKIENFFKQKKMN